MKKMILFFPILMLSACSLFSMKQDPLVGHWVEIMPMNKQIVQGINLNSDGTASSIGMSTLQYETWQRKDNQVLLTGKSIGNGQTIDFSDTLDIIEITPNILKLGKFGAYQIHYYRTKDVPDTKNMNNLPNLLQYFEGAGDLQTRVFEGTLPAASNPGIVYNITLYNYQNSEDGIFKARLTYLEAENGQDQTFEFAGRKYTLKGHSQDKNAVVWQFVPFGNQEETMNFVFENNKLTMLDQNLNPIKSKLNYTLELK